MPANIKNTGVWGKAQKAPKKVLFVLTSHQKLGDSNTQIGYWMEEVAASYEILSTRGIEVVFASPKGGEAPVDPESLLPQHLTYYTERFGQNEKMQKALLETVCLKEIKPEAFDGVLYLGGYGTLFDLMTDPVSIRLIEYFTDCAKPMGFVGHAVAALKYVRNRDGSPILKNMRITASSDSEEASLALQRLFSAVPFMFLRLGNFLTYFVAWLPSPEYASLMRLRGKLPFLMQRMLKREGAKYEKRRNWRPFFVEDLTKEGGHLLTGQNPFSAALLADRMAEIILDSFSDETLAGDMFF